MVIGVVGLVSIVPPLHEAAYAFGLLQIVWFIWVGISLLRTKVRVPDTEHASGSPAGHAFSAQTAASS
jgi:threonine/homoserine/homoserine lactone efflux protein